MCVCAGDETCLKEEAEMTGEIGGKKAGMFLKELIEPSGSRPSHWCLLT